MRNGTQRPFAAGFDFLYRAVPSVLELFTIFCLNSYLHLQAQAKGPQLQDTPRTQEEVDKWFEDFMRFLYHHIESKLSAELPSTKTWQSANIEFIFSVPTTWPPSGPTVEKFRRLVQQAGYGKYPTHSVSVGLTEAEAAAVAASIETPGLFQENDILMVCDAGGGTTDLSVLKVTGTYSGSLSLQQLDEVFGKNLGSTAIDRDFEDLVIERLESADRSLRLGIETLDAAWLMMKSSKFQNAKCDFGSPDDTPMFSVPVPGLPTTYTNRQYSLENGEMTFKQSDLQVLFDNQINGLFTLIDDQLRRFEQKYPSLQIAHLILSGGLGNSAYVQSRLKAQYGLGVSTFFSAKYLQLHTAPEPQLVVCQGLVLDRKAKLDRGRAVLGWRCCRESYGTVARLRYDKKNPDHFGKDVMKDPRDGKTYVKDGIVWFIKKGEAINVDVPIIHKFQRKITPGDPRRVFADLVVTSDADMLLLPIVLSQDGSVRELCEVTSNLSSIEESRFKKKNRHWWSIRKPYLRADYQIRVVIGPADIIFQLCKLPSQLSQRGSQY